jgi:hypothetical protein
VKASCKAPWKLECRPPSLPGVWLRGKNKLGGYCQPPPGTLLGSWSGVGQGLETLKLAGSNFHRCFPPLPSKLTFFANQLLSQASVGTYQGRRSRKLCGFWNFWGSLSTPPSKCPQGGQCSVVAADHKSASTNHHAYFRGNIRCSKASSPSFVHTAPSSGPS